MKDKDLKLMQEQYNKINEGLWDRAKAQVGGAVKGAGAWLSAPAAGTNDTRAGNAAIAQKKAKLESLLNSYTPKFLKLKQELDMDLAKLGIKEVDMGLINQLLWDIKTEVGLAGKGTGKTKGQKEESPNTDEIPVTSIKQPVQQ